MDGIDAFLRSATLLFALLNPFLLSIYLLDMIERLDAATFRRVIVRGCAISGVVFVAFAGTGEAFFLDLLQVRFASFLIFGGLIFLVIGVRYALQGPRAIEQLRGAPEHLAGAVAMPFMIGPGTIGASVLAGARLPLPTAAGAILSALAATAACLVGLKAIHDHVRRRNEALIARYVDVMGRLSALVIGTFAVEMILKGAEGWLRELRAL